MPKKQHDIVTRAILQEELSKELGKFEGKINKKLDKVLNTLDSVMGEFESIREDREISAYQTKEIRDQVDDHEKRLTKLEKPSQ